MKLFVWDFHGVLEIGNEISAMEFTNKVLTNNGYKTQMSLNECYLLYGKKWFEYFEYLLPMESKEVWMRLQSESINLSHKNRDVLKKYIKANKNSHKVLGEVSKKHDQILISNSSEKSLRIFTKITGVKKYFGKGKILSANKHLKRNKINKKDLLENYLNFKSYDKLVIIGDSPDDMDLAIWNNSVRYLYAHPGLKHRDADADYKINDLREVLKEL